MDEMMLEITEILKTAQELIAKRNDIFKNEAINAHIDRDGITLLMKDDLPAGDGIITYSRPSKSITGETYYIATKTMNGVKFENVRYSKEAGDDAEMAL